MEQLANLRSPAELEAFVRLCEKANHAERNVRATMEAFSDQNGRPHRNRATIHRWYLAWAIASEHPDPPEGETLREQLKRANGTERSVEDMRSYLLRRRERGPRGGDEDARAGEPAGVAALNAGSSHLAALLSAAERLAEQVMDLPDPEPEFQRIAKREDEEPMLLRAFDRRTGIWPGCLERSQIPPGNVYNEPAFRLLYQHTKDNPHWTNLGDWRQQDGLPCLGNGDGQAAPWWVEYDLWYMSRLCNLFERSRDTCQLQCNKACVDLGNKSGPLVFIAFVVRPVLDALRMHLQRPPLPPGESVTEHNTTNKQHGYILKSDGEVVASGIDDRGGAPNADLPRAVLQVRREFEERVLSAREPLEIVETWRHLHQRAEEFAQWLRGLTAAELAHGSCSVCAEDARRIFPELLEISTTIRGANRGGVNSDSST